LPGEPVDTIAAIATPRGNAGIGVIRLSGPGVPAILTRLTAKKIEPRKATLAKIHDSVNNLIDQVLILYFPAPHSFTGEDVVELQGHGGMVVMDMLLEHVIALGCRQARPGEFSERAFLNGKIDLAQAEAIADLIESHSRSAARGAMRSLQGEFSTEVHALVENLVHLRVLAEAYLDFPDEELDEIPENEFSGRLDQIIDETTDLLRRAGKGSLLRDGFHIVLAGRPNAGKSSLLNLLTRTDTAIVSSKAGTTRDIIRDRIDLDGMLIDLTDTAGLRHTDDEIEHEGVRRATRELGNADHVLLIVDEADYSEGTRQELLDFIDPEIPVTIVRNKIDLLDGVPGKQVLGKVTEIMLSVKSGAGTDILFDHLKSISSADSLSEGVFSARRRHIDSLERAKDVLLDGRQHIHPQLQLELLAEDCRQAQNHLNEITGEFGSEDLLGRIFSSFCIGK
jgi:tRNA modification GTPase